MSSRPSTPPWHQTDLVRILIGETISEVGSHVGSLALPFAAALTLQVTPGQMAVWVSPTTFHRSLSVSSPALGSIVGDAARC